MGGSSIRHLEMIGLDVYYKVACLFVTGGGQRLNAFARLLASGSWPVKCEPHGHDNPTTSALALDAARTGSKLSMS